MPTTFQHTVHRALPERSMIATFPQTGKLKWEGEGSVGRWSHFVSHVADKWQSPTPNHLLLLFLSLLTSSSHLLRPHGPFTSSEPPDSEKQLTILGPLHGILAIVS